ncbi:hypothetical protein [Treponema zioleckii]|uniref:hypothetical protein n=1 Tax=Treponema zioleckii TaxID=331680 RepID=UPI00168BC697|nr:hypothetical protein [Treponema zioleckii]
MSALEAEICEHYGIESESIVPGLSSKAMVGILTGGSLDIAATAQKASGSVINKLGNIAANVITWRKSISPTQDLIEGTNIPKSFVLNDKFINGKKIWVHGNATKHMGEFVNSAKGSILVENELMLSFQDTVSQILPNVKSGRQMFYKNGWEIGINGDDGVIYHALYK